MPKTKKIHRLLYDVLLMKESCSLVEQKHFELQHQNRNSEQWLTIKFHEAKSNGSWNVSEKIIFASIQFLGPTFLDLLDTGPYCRRQDRDFENSAVYTFDCFETSSWHLCKWNQNLIKFHGGEIDIDWWTDIKYKSG